MENLWTFTQNWKLLQFENTISTAHGLKSVNNEQASLRSIKKIQRSILKNNCNLLGLKLPLLVVY